LVKQTESLRFENQIESTTISTKTKNEDAENNQSFERFLCGDYFDTRQHMQLTP
jgi:hypothetical protein